MAIFNRKYNLEAHSSAENLDYRYIENISVISGSSKPVIAYQDLIRRPNALAAGYICNTRKFRVCKSQEK